MAKDKSDKNKVFLKYALIIGVASLLVFVGIVSMWHPRQQKRRGTEPKFAKTTTIAAEAGHPVSPPGKNKVRDIWRPAPKTSWQWQLSTPVDTTVEADMYDIDLFTNNADVVADLHAKNRKVVCYISAGSIEDWRPDAAMFPGAVIGKDYAGWPGEKWLDIRRLDVLGPIIEKRLDQCRDKGFDGVEPDNIMGFRQNTGFPLTYQHQLNFNTWLAEAAHTRGLSIGLKQDPDQAADLVSDYDWALDEECFEFQECDKMKPFILAGKAVFNAEYALGTDQFCADANARNFNSIRKHKELDVYRESCR